VPTKAASESPRTWCDNAGRRHKARGHSSAIPDIAAIDLFVVPTIGFNLLYGLAIIHLE
jgi:hypothetical protein